MLSILCLRCAPGSVIIEYTKSEVVFLVVLRIERTSKARLRGYVTDGLGRALEWHSRGQRFDPAYLHQAHCESNELFFFLISFFRLNSVRMA